MYSIRPLLVLTLIICIFPSISFCQYDQLNIENIDKSLLKSANAVVRYHEKVVDINDVDKMEISESVAITVFNEKSESLLDFFEYYASESSDIKDIKLIYLNADGSIYKKVKNKEISELDAYSYSTIASDSKYKKYDFVGDDYPKTIVYTFKEITSSTSFVPNWYPVMGFNIAVEKSSLLVNNESGVDLSHHCTNFEVYENVSQEGLFFSLENFNAIRSERYMPSFTEIIPKVEFSLLNFNYRGVNGSANNWVEYGQWQYDSFLKDRELFDFENVKSKLDKIIIDANDKREVIKKVYDFVQENTRYISIQINEGGFKPMSPKEVDELKYGDCKALSFYLVNLLDLYDITAHYTIINANDSNKKSLNHAFFNQQQANHAIVNVPLGKDTIWLDPTMTFAPYNFLDDFTDDRYCLSVSSTKSELVKTPKYDGAMNKNIVLGEINIDPSGNIEVDFKRDNIGIGFNQLKYYQQQTFDELKDHYNERDFRKLNNLKFENIDFDFDEENVVARELLNFTATSFCETLGDFVLIPMAFTTLRVPKLKKTKKRKFDIVFERGRITESYVTYMLPSGFMPSKLEDSFELTSKYGTYNCGYKYTLEDNSIEVKRSFILNEGKYSKEEYGEIKLFFDKILKQEQANITTKKKS